MQGEIGLVDAYIRILSIMNPFTAASVYLTVTEGLDEGEARRVALRSVALVAVLGTLVSLTGGEILGLLGISLAGLSMGGGILLLVISADMLTGTHRVRSVEEGEVGVVPLAVPMMFGPGTMTLLIHLSALTGEQVLAAAFLLALATVALVLAAARRLRRLLGMTGIKGLSRIIAVVIAGIAAEMIHSALLEWGIASR